MPKYLSCHDLKEAKENQDKLIREGYPNAWIETIIKGKEYLVHPGENPKKGKFVSPVNSLRK
jgi:hypothetical protein